MAGVYNRVLGARRFGIAALAICVALSAQSCGDASHGDPSNNSNTKAGTGGKADSGSGGGASLAGRGGNSTTGSSIVFGSGSGGSESCTMTATRISPVPPVLEFFDSCSYAIPAFPNGATPPLDKVNVSITNGTGDTALLGNDSDTSDGCNHGWQFAANNTQILLCSDACALTKADPALVVEMLIGCSTLL